MVIKAIQICTLRRNSPKLVDRKFDVTITTNDITVTSNVWNLQREWSSKNGTRTSIMSRWLENENWRNCRQKSVIPPCQCDIMCFAVCGIMQGFKIIYKVPSVKTIGPFSSLDMCPVYQNLYIVYMYTSFTLHESFYKFVEVLFIKQIYRTCKLECL